MTDDDRRLILAEARATLARIPSFTSRSPSGCISRSAGSPSPSFHREARYAAAAAARLERLGSVGCDADRRRYRGRTQVHERGHRASARRKSARRALEAEAKLDGQIASLRDDLRKAEVIMGKLHTLITSERAQVVDLPALPRRDMN